MGVLRRSVRRFRLAVGKIARRGARLRAATDARRRNIVVGPTFTYHVVNRPEETGDRPSPRR